MRCWSEYILSAIRCINSGALKYSMVAIITRVYYVLCDN